MKSVRILIPEKGSGFKHGQVVEVKDSEADRLIQAGIAERAVMKKKYKTKEEKFNG